MQISRLFEIVYILLHRRHITARELAARFEVSVRTIYRDIDALSQAGVPVYATQGSGGGIHISDTYVLNKSALTDQEQEQILFALRSVSAAGNMETERLLARLYSLFKKDSADDWIEVDFSRWGNTEGDQQVLAAIKEGILGRHPLAFTYYGGNGVKTHRTVSPVKLVYKSRAWYLQALCHERQAYRTFKLVRMADVAVLPETFDRKSMGTPPQVDAGLEEPIPKTLVTIRFAPYVAWRAMDEFDPSLITRGADGGVVACVPFPEDDWTYTYILSYGAGAEVLSPPHLRRKMADLLRQMLERYE